MIQKSIKQVNKSLELYKQILKLVYDRKWLEKKALDQKYIKNLVENIEFKNRVFSMVSQKDFSCFSVFSLCSSIFTEINPNYTTEEWLHIIYQYSLSKAFPHSIDFNISQEIKKACDIYIRILKPVCEAQKDSNDDTWQSKYPLTFLSPEEISNLENPTEYNRFIKAFNNDFVYETMKLNQEVLHYNTLDHICGVHHIAMHLGRQLLNAGINIDLGRVSGAAAGHDIGKYGCREYESKRVPYLHYYYTDLWFKKHDIPYIGHIAVNHSTWDLELENLPIESLLLIYSDFRVKNIYKKDSKPQMHIFSLRDSFDVILNKLDNLDQLKIKRYQRVYSKLKDFEDYMIHLGIDVENLIPIKNINNDYKNKKSSFALMHGKSIIENMKYLSIEHNINLMYMLRDEYSLNRILELARSQENWKNLRKYIQALEEYSAYLTQKQKLITLRFLYDELIHPEDDIRKQCAGLIGRLIGTFDEEYRKEVPQNVVIEPQSMTGYELFNRYLEILTDPDHKIIPLHREWIRYSISAVVSSLFFNCKISQTSGYRKVLLDYYEKYLNNDNQIQLYLIEAAKYIPVSDNDESLELLFNFILEMLNKPNHILRLSALETIINILPFIPKGSFIDRLRDMLKYKSCETHSPSEDFLICKTIKIINANTGNDIPCLSVPQESIKISDIFLSNLKSATDWVTKRVQIEMQMEYALYSPENIGLYTSMHFCNLLKVSAIEGVRNHAGEALIKIVPCLSPEQRNDVAIELLRALEIEGYQYTEYIPSYLGRIILFLEPVELDEIINDLKEKIKQSSPELNSLLLKTIGVAIANYSKYRNISNESDDNFNERLIKLLGILLNGLVNYNIDIKQYAFIVIGRDIFGSSILNYNEKEYIFRLVAKKLLTLITYDRKDELQLLTNAASLNHIYRFISDYTFFKGEIKLDSPEKIAFFPGTFDPFSLSHKEITKSIADLGFEVYLQVDEFSWSKQTLPNILRRNIINMSVADELNTFIYPEDSPTNIANPQDLKRLKDNFPNSEVYIVVGSDVLINASSYKQEKSNDLIFSFSHIIFDRKSLHPQEESGSTLNNTVKKITGDVIRLSLPTRYEDISSSQIRNNIDENRDVSSLLDPLVQNYIYENGFYRREPQYKALIKTVSTEFEVVENLNLDILKRFCILFENRYINALKKLSEILTKDTARMIAARDAKDREKILGFSVFHWVRSSSLFLELKNSTITEFIRSHAAGRIIVIDGIYINHSNSSENLEQILLTETLSYCLAKDYDYAVFKNIIDGYVSKNLYEILELQGFIRMPSSDNDSPVFVVNMNDPCTLSLDVETMLKEPFRSNANIKQSIIRSRKMLQKSLTQLYPGNLVLSFDINIIHENIVKKICLENGVSTLPSIPQKLGQAMCVPFGNILSRYIVPNTVTKALHTEKLFAPDMKSFTIGPYPYYLDLENQVKMLRSFNRPIILVDDLLNKGYRIKALDPLLNNESIKVQKIIVGILSGRGKELMDIQKREVESAYFLPKLKHWFNESAQYPFIGGDTLWRGVYPKRNLVPSINLILPYTSPGFIREASKKTIYNLSHTCIENAIDIFVTLEKEYQTIHERTLTLASMGEVFTSPRCPDHGTNMHYNLNLSPSHYLLNDLELLERMENIINRP